MDKKPALNLFLISLAICIFLIVWMVMSSSPNPSGESSFIASVKETLRSFQGVSRVDSSAKAVSVAESIFASRPSNLPRPQVVDVEFLPYGEAIMRVSGIRQQGTGGMPAEVPIWLVIFYTGSDAGKILVPTLASKPDSLTGECTYVFVEPQKGIAFRSGFMHDCGW
jgi:hypothetical protein